MGLRGRERNWQKPPGIRRILVLGDSIAFGYGVREEDTFAQTLENLLNGSNRPRRWEVIDSGVPAYNTTQEVTYFQQEGIRFGADIVILALYWNDIHDKTGVRVDDLGRLVEKGADEKTNWWRELFYSREAYKLRNFVKQSRLLYFITDRLGYLLSGFDPKDARLTQTSVLLGTPNSKVTQGWKNIETQLEQLSDICRSRTARLLVVILPMPEQLARSYPNIQYQSVVRNMCARHRIECLDILPSFQNVYTDHTSLFISYDGDHPNEQGHALVAQELFRTITAPFPLNLENQQGQGNSRRPPA